MKTETKVQESALTDSQVDSNRKLIMNHFNLNNPINN